MTPKTSAQSTRVVGPTKRLPDPPTAVTKQGLWASGIFRHVDARVGESLPRQGGHEF